MSRVNTARSPRRRSLSCNVTTIARRDRRHEAHRIAERIMIMEAGKLVTIGPTKGVLRDR